MNYNSIKKRFDLQVDVANATITKTFELDKTIVFVKGVAITSDKDDLLFYRGAQKIEINKEEIFPEGYESKLLMTGINVNPNQRFYEVGKLPPGNGKVVVNFKDSDDGRSVFTPYRVTLYLTCEQ